MANLLFKVYFKLNSTSLCKNLTNGIKHSELAPFESYPASHRVSTSLPVEAALTHRADDGSFDCVDDVSVLPRTIRVSEGGLRRGREALL